jgi:hypothetical protein
VVLLDGSYSMQAPADAGTAYDAALAATDGVLAALPEGSTAQVLHIGGGAAALAASPTSDLDSLRQQVRDAPAGLARADAVDGLTVAAESVEAMEQPGRQIVLVSDFQSASWIGDQATGRAALTAMLEQMPVRPQLTFFQTPGSSTNNLAVTDVQLSPAVVGVNQRVTVRATIANLGDEDAPAVPVALLVDGEQIDRSRIAVDAGQTQQVLFIHRFETGGSRLLQVQLEGDALEADNTHHLALDVLDQLPVLLVGPQTDRPFPENETDFLELALSPFASNPDDPAQLSDLLSATSIPPDEFDAAAIDGQAVIVLANIATLEDEQVQLLQEHVQRGGGLIVFPGDRTRMPWWNENLFNNGNGLLPARITGLAGVGLSTAEPVSPASQRFDHPVLELWNEPATGGLRDLRLSVWTRLEPAEAASGTSDQASGGGQAAVLARLNGGDPLLVARPFGEGVVVQFATAADADWSNLPVRPSYVALMQQAAVWAATRASPPRTVPAGRPLVALLTEPPTSDVVTVTDPAGRQTRTAVVQQDGRWAVRLPDTRLPGVYRVDVGDQPLQLAANAPRDESRLEPLSAEQLAALAADLDAEVVTDLAAYEDADRKRRHGTPLWPALAVIVLALLFGELLVQQWAAGEPLLGGQRKPRSHMEAA